MSTIDQALELELASQPQTPPQVDELHKARADGRFFKDALRHALRHSLDFAVRPVHYNADGTQTCLDTSDMVHIYNRRRAHMIAYVGMLRWASVQTKKVAWLPVACPMAACPLVTPRIAVSFWHSTDSAPKKLPHALVEGLASCVRNSGLTVFLLTYQMDLADIPAGVCVRDANSILAWPIAARLLLNRRVQHLSDYVRVRALVHGVEGGAEKGGGWLIDGDTIWLRHAPTLSVACPPNLGHWFSCQQACRAMRGHDKAGITSHWLRNYLKTPGDFLHIAFPCAAPPSSPVMRCWLDRMEVELFGDAPMLEYNIFMAALQHSVCTYGMEKAVAEVQVCSAFDRLKSVHAGDRDKRHLFDASVLASAMIVNNIWQSSMKCKNGNESHDLGEQRADIGSIWREVEDRWKQVPTHRLRGKQPCLQKSLPSQSGEGGVPPSAPVVAPTPTSTQADQGCVLARTAVETPAPAAAAVPVPWSDEGGVPPNTASGASCIPTERPLKQTRTTTVDAGVGESLWGDAFMWRGIWDMP